MRRLWARLTTVNDWSFWGHQRELWAAGLLKPDCTECPAVSGQWCDPMYPPPAEMVLIDRDPPHLVHSARVAAAVSAGYVSRKTTIAQFAGGPVAAGLVTGSKRKSSS